MIKDLWSLIRGAWRKLRTARLLAQAGPSGSNYFLIDDIIAFKPECMEVLFACITEWQERHCSTRDFPKRTDHGYREYWAMRQRVDVAKAAFYRIGGDAIEFLLERSQYAEADRNAARNHPITEMLKKFGEAAILPTVNFILRNLRDYKYDCEEDRLAIALEVLGCSDDYGFRLLLKHGLAKPHDNPDPHSSNPFYELVKALAIKYGFSRKLCRVICEEIALRPVRLEFIEMESYTPSPDSSVQFPERPIVRDLPLPDLYAVINAIGPAAAPCVKKMVEVTLSLTVEQRSALQKLLKLTDEHEFNALDDEYELNALDYEHELYPLSDALSWLESHSAIDEECAVLCMESYIFGGHSTGRSFEALPLPLRERAVALFNSKHKNRVLSTTNGEFPRALYFLRNDGLIKLLNLNSDLSEMLRRIWLSETSAEMSHNDAQAERYAVELFSMKHRGVVLGAGTIKRMRQCVSTPGLLDEMARKTDGGFREIAPLPRSDLSACAR